MRFEPVQLLAFCAFTLGILTTGCRDSDKVKVEHREYSEEETEKAVQKAFVEQTDGAIQEVPAGVDRFFTLLGRATRSETEIDGEQFLSMDGNALRHRLRRLS